MVHPLRSMEHPLLCLPTRTSTLSTMGQTPARCHRPDSMHPPQARPPRLREAGRSTAWPRRAPPTTSTRKVTSSLPQCSPTAQAQPSHQQAMPTLRSLVAPLLLAQPPPVPMTTTRLPPTHQRMARRPPWPRAVEPPRALALLPGSLLPLTDHPRWVDLKAVRPRVAHPRARPTAHPKRLNRVQASRGGDGPAVQHRSARPLRTFCILRRPGPREHAYERHSVDHLYRPSHGREGRQGQAWLPHRRLHPGS
mmetsp:Transcript_18683/g.31832  ORF Transcript_18683/g.31832 Transcript_18683/m.31832 type:complete len:251 (+) Transcript_18683:897-1649(+)